MSWRVAESLKQLREQINAAYPNRDRSSDGSIGDAAHASRSSDHNPWVKDSRGQGVVTAVDIDADLTPTVKVGVIVDALIASKDPRIKYIIFNRRIIASYPTGGVAAWKWRPYSGVNAHTQHAHISVNSSPYHYDSRAEWNIAPVPPKRLLSEREVTAVVNNFQEQKQAEPGPVEIPPPLERTPSSEAATQEQATDPAVPAPLPLGIAGGAAEGAQPGSFAAHVPQIDTAKTWLASLFGMTGIGTVISVVAGLPLWLQVGLFSLVVLIIVGIIVIFVKYHEQIFRYVTGMNTLRATEGVGDPVLSGPPE